jgi:hypothetical protein
MSRRLCVILPRYAEAQANASSKQRSSECVRGRPWLRQHNLNNVWLPDPASRVPLSFWIAYESITKFWGRTCQEDNGVKGQDHFGTSARYALPFRNNEQLSLTLSSSFPNFAFPHGPGQRGAPSCWINTFGVQYRPVSRTTCADVDSPKHELPPADPVFV